MPPPPAIQSLWIGNPLSRLEKLCVQSFMDHGHEFHLYVYDDVGGIPDGAIIKDGNEVLPESEIFILGGEAGPFSDWFRYALLSQSGNYWVDMDTICLRPLDFPEDVVFGTLGFGEHEYPNGILKFPKGHECMLALEKSCRHYGMEMPWDDTADKQEKHKFLSLGSNKSRATRTHFGGPPVFTKAAKYYGLEGYAKPYMFFYSLDNSSCLHTFDGSYVNGIRLFADAYTLHAGNYIMSNHLHGFNKNATFSTNSLFEQLAVKHAVKPVADAPHLDHNAVHAIFVSQEMSEKAREKREKYKSRKKRKVLAFWVSILAFLIGYAM